jgi:peroxiredoxin
LPNVDSGFMQTSSDKARHVPVLGSLHPENQKSGKSRFNSNLPHFYQPYCPFGRERNSGRGHFGGDWIIEEFTTDHGVSADATPIPLFKDRRAAHRRQPDTETMGYDGETMKAGIQIGAAFPDYELSDHTGTKRRLSDLQGIDPMILVLSRGHYCPKDRRQHRHLVDFYPELKVGYARIVTISTDNLLLTNEFRDGLGAQWTFLSDPGRRVQKDLDIAEYTDPDHNPMIPHTLVLEPQLKIFKIYNGYWYWGRPTIEEHHPPHPAGLGSHRARTP